MISNTSSSTNSFQLRLVVTVLICLGTLSLLIAISTNHWIKANGDLDIQYFGLWKACTTTICIPHSAVIYSKVLLVFAILFAILSSILVILALVYGVTDVKKATMKMASLTGMLAFFGMLAATIVFIIDPLYKSIEYGLIIGWICPVLYFFATILSWYHNRQEPDRNMTIEELRQQMSANNTQAPPYMAQPPPGSVVVT